MADKNVNVKIVQRNDTSANWKSINPILLKGEMGVEIDTNKIKIGDGAKAWNSLDYAGGNSGGAGGIHIGPTAPSDTKLLWLDTSGDESALDGVNYISLIDNATGTLLTLRVTNGRIELAN